MSPAGRPLLLLDVDGVLCPLGPGCGEELVEVEGGEYPLVFSSGTPRRLQVLGETFTLIWATSWEERANHLLVPALGLPPLPVLRFPLEGGRPGSSCKLAPAMQFACDRPMAWLDDEVGDDMAAWARGRRTPTLIREIDPRLGLADGDVAALLQFAEGLGGTRPSAGVSLNPSPAR